VRREGTMFVDDDGPFLFAGYSLFSALAHLLQDNEEWVQRNLDAALALDGPRVLLCMGSPGDNNWEDRMVDPRHPRFKDELRKLLHMIRERKQRGIFDIFGDVTLEARSFGLERHVDQCCDVFLEFPDQILYVKISNEGIGISDQEIRHLAERVKARTPFLISGVSSMDEFDVYAARTERKVTGDGGIWDHTEQPYDMHKQSSRILCDEEPIGFESSINKDNDPLRNAAHAACAYVTGGAAYVLHTRVGVRGGGKVDVAKFGPWQNLWEQPDGMTWCGCWRRCGTSIRMTAPGGGESATAIRRAKGSIRSARDRFSRSILVGGS